MEHHQQKQLFDEINGYIDNDSTALADAEMTQLAAAYFDPEHHARERALIRTLPIIVGHASRLKEAGDYFAHKRPRVCAAGHGSRKTFTCPYHAWTYRADGRLLAAQQPSSNISRRQFRSAASAIHRISRTP